MDKNKLSNIKNIKFEYIDPVEKIGYEPNKMRVGADDIIGMPDTYEENQGVLRERIIEIFENKLDGMKTKIEEYCDIDRTTFTHYINGKRGITKQNLVKFIIGLGLNIYDAKELLALNDTPLNSRACRFDYIAELAIEDGDQLDDFMKELVEHGCKDISKQSVR